MNPMNLIVQLLVQGGQMALVLVAAPLVVGVVRKAKARLLRRRGPSVIQPYRDLLRLARKEVVLAENASWLFRAAPYLIFAATWVAAALVPTFARGLLFSWTADLIAITALLGSARFFLALAGLDVGTGFGGIGASREVMIASLAEPAMLLMVFSVALVAGSTQLSTVAAVMSSEAGLRVSLGLALIALVMVAIAENSRIPIDNPATHLELTMVHEAMVLEYSGRHLAMLELASALKLTLYISLIACLFAPWGLASVPAGASEPAAAVALPDGAVTGGAAALAAAAAAAPVAGFAASAAAYAIGIMSYALKLAVGCVLLAIFETAVAKMRVFRVPEFLGAALMLGLLGTLLLFFSRSL
jgi:formate hydrogenlyase subunit 4